MKHLSLLFVVFFSLVAVAKADFDVAVSTDGKTIEAPVFGKIDFIDRIASVDAYSADSGGIFFAQGEDFITQLRADGYEIHCSEKSGVTTNVGNIYFVIAFELDGKKFAALSPVLFSAFGVGLHVSETESVHSGTVVFNDNWLRYISEEKYKL